MKALLKLLAIAAILALCASLAACGGKCKEHVDGDKDGVCDSCEQELSPEGNGGEDDNGGDGEDDPTPDAPKTGNKVGNVCYAFDLDALLADDQVVNIEDYRGKVVVINFWGTWCVPCMSELPHFNQIAADMADDVTVVAVHSSREGENLDPINYANEHFAGSKMVFARDTAIGNGMDKYYGILGGDGYYPFTLVLDADGVITYKGSGSLNYESLSLLIEEAKK